MDNLHYFLAWVASLPGIDRLLAWLISFPSLTFPQLMDELTEALLKLLGLRELVKYVYRFAFRKKSRLQRKIEILEEELAEKKRELSEANVRSEGLEDALIELRRHLPEFAIERADREWRDGNEEKGIRQLDDWLSVNSNLIAQIGLHLAKFHISRAVPNPGEHLTKARRLIQLATAAAPDSIEIAKVWREFDIISAALQEQMIIDEQSQIVWNSGMSERLSATDERLLPIVLTFRDIALYCIRTGKTILAPIFADRAASLARQTGSPLRYIWFSAESDAAYIHHLAKADQGALERLDSAIAAAALFMDARHALVLKAKSYRASMLLGLGRYPEAIAEIDELLPIQTAVCGERDLQTLSLRFVHASALRLFERKHEALKIVGELLLI